MRRTGRAARASASVALAILVGACALASAAGAEALGPAGPAGPAMTPGTPGAGTGEGLASSRAIRVPAPAGVLADDPLPTPEPTPVEANQRADDILADPAYQPPSRTLLQRVVSWLGDRLAQLIGSVMGGGTGSVVSWLVIGLAVGLVAFFVARLGRTVQPAPVQPGETSVEVRRSTADWRAEAERCEAAGDWRGGLRCRYRALVGDLVRREVLRDVPGRTAGEYRVELAAARPSAAPEFAGVSELFERAWYGNLPTGPAERDRFRDLAEVVEREASR